MRTNVQRDRQNVAHVADCRHLFRIRIYPDRNQELPDISWFSFKIPDMEKDCSGLMYKVLVMGAVCIENARCGAAVLSALYSRGIKYHKRIGEAKCRDWEPFF